MNVCWILLLKTKMRYFLLGLFACLCSSAFADLRYSLSVDVPGQSVRVSLELEAKSGANDFSIPAWCPGFYTIKNYQTKISDFRVRREGGVEIAVAKNGDRTWRAVLAKAETITISYRVLGDDGGLGFFGTQIDGKHAFVNGPSAFVYPDQRTTEKCTLKITTPTGWEVATAMPVSPNGGYSTGNYDELIDHPIQLGQMSRKSFTVSNIPFEVVVASPTGRYPNMDTLAASLALTSRPAIQMFGSAPFKKYMYIIHLAIGDFAGGLEHRASNVIATQFENPLELGTLASHEYFHAWNVKQIRPKMLGPFDYSKQVRTRNLWFSEGVTDYYAHMHYYSSGQMAENDLLSSLGYQIDELQTSRTRRTKTLEDACWSTWESGGFGFGDLSYYTKGLLCGLLLDAAILEATNGESSLDDVMKMLYANHALPKPGFEEDDIRQAVNYIAGKDLTALYNSLVRSTDELPYDRLRSIGLEVLPQNSIVEDFGFDVDRQATVCEVRPEISAMGLLEGDKIAELDGKPFDNQSWRDNASPAYSARILRNGLPLSLNLRKIAVPSPMYRVRKVADPTERVKMLYSKWLDRLGN